MGLNFMLISHPEFHVDSQVKSFPRLHYLFQQLLLSFRVDEIGDEDISD